MRERETGSQIVRLYIRGLLVGAIVFLSMLMVQRVNAGAQTLIGEMPTMSSGAGLVIAVSLQRAGTGDARARRNVVASIRH